MPRETRLDPKLASLLRSLRNRARRTVVWDSLLLLAAVLLLGFWVGLAIDFLPVQVGGTEMPRSARTVLLTVVGLVAAAVLVRSLWGRLVRKLPDDSLALLVERHHPVFAGRLVTTIQLCQPGRTGDAHAEGLLAIVHREAASMVDRVDPDRIFRRDPLVKKAVLVVPLAAAVVMLAAISPPTFLQAAGRLSLWSDVPWPRKANLEMVGVELPKVSAEESAEPVTELVTFDEKRMRLPKGSDGTLRIRARAEDAQVPDLCTVFYRTDDGTRGQANMRRIGRVVDGYQAFVLDGVPLAGLADSMTISIRGLDDRLEDYRIEAVEPPAIANLRVEVRYPDYLRRRTGSGPDLETEYRAGLRIREGSEVTLVASGSRPLAGIDLDLRDDRGDRSDVPFELSEDRTRATLRFDDFRSATTIRAVPRGADGISAQAPFRYYLGVVLDEPPDVSVKLTGIGSAVTPIARIPLQATVDDDYGVRRLDVTVAAEGGGARSEGASGAAEGGEDETSGDSGRDTEGVPGASGERPTSASRRLDPDRDGEAETVVDLRDLAAEGGLRELEPGQSLRVYGEASDGYDLTPREPSRSEVFRIEVVTPEALLALLERRELSFRTRLEQTIDETRGLRDSIESFRGRWLDEPEPQPSGDGDGDGETPAEEEAESGGGTESGAGGRETQVRRLRVQQASLQADKTSEELSGIVASLGDLLEEMVNNRVDSVDRRERIGDGVRTPLRRVVEGPMARLREQLTEVLESIDDREVATGKAAEAVDSAEQVLLDLTAVLEKMLDLESYNEILDLFRDLIDDQEKLLEETKQQQKRSVLDLFD